MKYLLITLLYFGVLYPARSQIITTVAGSGVYGYSGDGGAATSAQMIPYAVAVDAAGNIFIADHGNHRIRKVNSAGIITTVAGNGVQGFGGDGGPATAAALGNPTNLAVDATGNIFIADGYNNRIRKVDVTGIITTVVGNGTAGFSGDGGPATAAQLNLPTDVAVDAAGNIFIIDQSNERIRKVAPNGIISTAAGNGVIGYSGDGGAGANAQLSSPTGLDVDATGNIFFADQGNQRVRKIATNGIITTVAGTGVYGYSGDGAAATSANLSAVIDVAVNATGELFIADQFNQRIRKVDVNGIITTIAGNGTAGFSGDGGPATQAQLNSPYGITLDASGNIFIGDEFNYRIRKVTVVPVPTIHIQSNVAFPICAGTPVTFTSTITNAGSSPTYQWKKNGINVGANSPTYTDGALNNNDLILCMLIASGDTATSNSIQCKVSTTSVANLGADTYYCIGDSLQLYPGAFATYIWQDGSTKSHYTVKHPGTYSVTVTNNCGTGSSHDEINVTEKICSIYFPTAFTPNNDRINDVFKILNPYNLTDFHIVIYDRWAQKVFESTDYTKGWDGTIKGQRAEMASYVWYCEFINPGHTTKTKMKGQVILIR